MYLGAEDQEFYFSNFLKGIVKNLSDSVASVRDKYVGVFTYQQNPISPILPIYNSDLT